MSCGIGCGGLVASERVVALYRKPDSADGDESAVGEAAEIAPPVARVGARRKYQRPSPQFELLRVQAAPQAVEPAAAFWNRRKATA
jgi:hypothetical protein